MQKRAFIDRRQIERREGFRLVIMDALGVERRRKERRTQPEKRHGWVRVSGWISVKV